MFSERRQQLIWCRFPDWLKKRHPSDLALLRTASHHSAIDLKTPGLRQHFMVAECFIQHIRIRQKRIRHDAQLTTNIQMAHRAANQLLRGIEAGLHPIVEGRV